MAHAEELYKELKRTKAHDEAVCRELAAVVAYAKEIREGAFSLG